MKKFIPTLLIVLFSLITSSVFAQSPMLWEQYCSGTISLIPQGEGVLVQCVENQSTNTPTPTDDPISTITSTPTDSPTPTHTLTPTPADEPTSTPTPTQTDEPTPTQILTPTPTDEPTSTPTHTLTPTPTDEPTSTPTPTPTDEPTSTQTPTEEPTRTATPTYIPPTPTAVPPTPTSMAKIVDHTNVDLFNQIPANYLTTAAGLKMAFMNRSVGANISAGLDCLASLTWGQSPQFCRVAYTNASMTTSKTYMSRDLPNVPAEIMFTGGLSRANWTYDLLYQGTWEDMTRDFINVKFPMYSAYDVVGFQFSYLNVVEGSTIDERFFNRTYTGWNILDLEALIDANPGTTFLFWTTSLSRAIGTPDATSLNRQFREYMATSFAQQHDIWLIDIADIESHDMVGNLCTLSGNPIVCKDYTTETVGGHLGSISTGMLRTAKSVWVIMSRIAGWQP